MRRSGVRRTLTRLHAQCEVLQGYTLSSRFVGSGRSALVAYAARRHRAASTATIAVHLSSDVRIAGRMLRCLRHSLVEPADAARRWALSQKARASSREMPSTQTWSSNRPFSAVAFFADDSVPLGGVHSGFTG